MQAIMIEICILTRTTAADHEDQEGGGDLQKSFHQDVPPQSQANLRPRFRSACKHT